MWESKEQTIDLNYNADKLWFTGVYGQPVPKPLYSRDSQMGREHKVFQVIGQVLPSFQSRSHPPRPLTNCAHLLQTGGAATAHFQAKCQRGEFGPRRISIRQQR